MVKGLIKAPSIDSKPSGYEDGYPSCYSDNIMIKTPMKRDGWLIPGIKLFKEESSY